MHGLADFLPNAHVPFQVENAALLSLLWRGTGGHRGCLIRDAMLSNWCRVGLASCREREGPGKGSGNSAGDCDGRDELGGELGGLSESGRLAVSADAGVGVTCYKDSPPCRQAREPHTCGLRFLPAQMWPADPSSPAASPGS